MSCCLKARIEREENLPREIKSNLESCRFLTCLVLFMIVVMFINSDHYNIEKHKKQPSVNFSEISTVIGENGQKYELKHTYTLKCLTCYPKLQSEVNRWQFFCEKEKILNKVTSPIISHYASRYNGNPITLKYITCSNDHCNCSIVNSLGISVNFSFDYKLNVCTKKDVEHFYIIRGIPFAALLFIFYFLYWLYIEPIIYFPNN